MPVAPCAFPVHLKDISHPGEVSRQSCTYWSCLLISNCLPKVLKFWEMLTDLPALWECKKQLKVNTHSAQAVSFVWGGNPVQFSSRSSWTPTSPTPNPLDRTELPHLSSLHALRAKTTSQVSYSCLFLQFRYFLLILCSHFHSFSVRESRSCSSETKLQKSIMAEKADKERTSNIHARL